MRTHKNDQLTLVQAWSSSSHPRALEMRHISQILDENADDILELVHKDLVGQRDPKRGRKGLTAEQVLRLLVVKRITGWSYEILAFELSDRGSYRHFCRIGDFERPLTSSTLQANISRVRAPTIQALNRKLSKWAKDNQIENGKKIRSDCTVVESNIHPPTDSSLLWDVVRVLVRLMTSATVFGLHFSSHSRRAKKRSFEISNCKSAAERKTLYVDLLKTAEMTLDDARRLAGELKEAAAGRDIMTGIKMNALAIELGAFISSGVQVVKQTHRRIVLGDSVPANEKLFSIFETHTDIVVKGRRDVEYGHKICLTTGSSAFVLDCEILDGNPADSSLAVDIIDRHSEVFGAPPRQAAFDAGFASKNNVMTLKARRVEDVSFSKRCGLKITDMVRSAYVHKKLQRFRGGIEGVISFLKRAFALGRCNTRGRAHFDAYVHSSVLAANLLVLARHCIAAA